MNKSFAILLTLALAAILASASVIADDVTVRTIDPTKPVPADQAKSPTQPDQPPPAGVTQPTRPLWGTSPATKTDDGPLDGAIFGLRLSAEQASKVNPILEKFAAQIKPLAEERNAVQAKVAEKSRDWQARYQAWIGAGADQEKLKPLPAELTAMKDERDAAIKKYEDAVAKARTELADKLMPLLTPEQAKRFSDFAESRSTDPAMRARWATKSAIMAVFVQFGGIQLSDEQMKQAIPLVHDIQAQWNKDSAALMDERDASSGRRAAEMQQKFRLISDVHTKAIRDALRKILTPEQRTALEQAEAKWRERIARASTDTVMGHLSMAVLTADQQKKVDELVAAAREAMSKLDKSSDVDALQQQLVNDIKALLTDEQKAKLKQSQLFAPADKP